MWSRTTREASFRARAEVANGSVAQLLGLARPDLPGRHRGHGALVSATVTLLDGEIKRRLVVTQSERILRGHLAEGASPEYAASKAIAYVEATMGAIPADLSADVWQSYHDLAVAILGPGKVEPEGQS